MGPQLKSKEMRTSSAHLCISVTAQGGSGITAQLCEESTVLHLGQAMGDLDDLYSSPTRAGESYVFGGFYSGLEKDRWYW